MLISDIINAISIKLNTVFGDAYEIYTENVKQGLKEPCFFIKTLPMTNQPLLGKRAKRTYSFVISYFTLNGNEEMMQVSETLMDELEYITLLNGDMIRGSSLEGEIVDDVLQFSVNYIVIVNEVQTSDAMETLSEIVELKGV